MRLSEDYRPVRRIHEMLFGFARLALLLAFVLPPAFATGLLDEGDWKGKFLPYDAPEPEKILYRVIHSEDSSELKIKMINLTLEPRSEHSYELADIEVNGNQLRFKIPKEFETVECSLEHENQHYSGTCFSSAGDQSLLSRITMSPHRLKVKQDNETGNQDGAAASPNDPLNSAENDEP